MGWQEEQRQCSGVCQGRRPTQQHPERPHISDGTDKRWGRERTRARACRKKASAKAAPSLWPKFVAGCCLLTLPQYCPHRRPPTPHCMAATNCSRRPCHHNNTSTHLQQHNPPQPCVRCHCQLHPSTLPPPVSSSCHQWVPPLTCAAAAPSPTDGVHQRLNALVVHMAEAAA